MMILLQLGDYVYEVDMLATQADPEDIPLMQAELGNAIQHTISLRNPLECDVSITAVSSNARSFTIAPAMSSIVPFGEAELTITFRPCSLGKWLVLSIMYLKVLRILLARCEACTFPCGAKSCMLELACKD